MSEYTVNIELSPFALWLRIERLKNGLTVKELSEETWIRLDRLYAFEIDNAEPCEEEKAVLEAFFDRKS